MLTIKNFTPSPWNIFDGVNSSKIIIDSKEYHSRQNFPSTWGGPDTLSPGSEISVALSLSGERGNYDISEGVLAVGEHHIAVKMNQTRSNTIAIKVVEKGKTPPDPIERLVERLSKNLGWTNGVFPAIKLPSTATTEQVVSEVFRMTGFDQGHVTSYKVMQTKDVQIPVGMPLERYTAVLVQTNFGEKIALLKYEGGSSGWWSRVYDIEKEQ